jgi:hypothetical protein
MEFTPTKEQKQLQKELSAFAEKSFKEFAASRGLWKALGEQRIPGLIAPEVHGGRGLGATSAALALEGIGSAVEDQGVMMALGAHLFAGVAPLAAFGSEAQKKALLPGLCDGSRIATGAAAEPEGSHVAEWTTVADRDGAGFVIRGEKTLLTNGPVADLAIVYAVTDGEKRAEGGITAFLVDTAASGVRRGPAQATMGLAAAQLGSLVMDGARVGTDAVLGRVGDGMAVLEHALLWERSLLSAGQVGQMQKMLDRTIAYARARKANGQPIGKHQSVSHKITDMKMRVEAARLLTYRAAWMLDTRPKEAALSASVNKVFVSEAFLKASLDAVQIMGGKGYLVESNVERLVRDSLGGTLYSGSNDAQRTAIAEALGL